MRKGNPVLKKGFDKEYLDVQGKRMTLAGSINKTFMLLSLLLVTAVYSWVTFFSSGNVSTVYTLAMGGIIGGLLFGLITAFIPRISMITAPIYALCEGLFIGAISSILEINYPGIVLQAVGLTFGILLALLILYKARIVRATEKFKTGVFAATLGICIVYAINMALSFLGIHMPYLHQGGMIGMGISLFIIVIASLNLILDFDFIEQGVAHGAPKYMEWYAGYGLMVTLVWLYIEVLRLLKSIKDRD